MTRLIFPLFLIFISAMGFAQSDWKFVAEKDNILVEFRNINKNELKVRITNKTSTKRLVSYEYTTYDVRGEILDTGNYIISVSGNDFEYHPFTDWSNGQLNKVASIKLQKFKIE